MIRWRDNVIQDACPQVGGRVPEKLDRQSRHKHSSANRVYAKKQTSRKWRRLGKKHLEDAPPRRPTKGWES